MDTETRTRAQRIGFWLGPALALLIALAPPPQGLSPEALRVAGLAAWMAVWWASEAVPLAATSLLPLILLPLMGAGTEAQAASPYASPIVLLLMGGFIVALAIERWGLHRRIALNVLARAGDRPLSIVAGFLIATALISMWISNTATALMMTPIALSVAAAGGGARFAQALVLAVMYAASIGGVATPIGTPTNLIAMNWISEELGRTIAFTDWMLLGLPAAALLLVPAFFIAAIGVSGARVAGAAAEIRAELQALGPVTTPEWRVIAIFALIAGLWVFGEPIRAAGVSGLTDMGVAVLGAVLALIIPAGAAQPGRALLSWGEAVKIPWGVVLLFGGGISLANAMDRTGLGLWMGEQLAVLAAAPVLAVIFVIVLLALVVTEFMSNVASITLLLPVLGALALALGVDPVTLIAPAAIAASCAFMMPAGTGPNAVAFGTGAVPIGAMIRRGVMLNAAAALALTGLGAWLAPVVLG